jgi:hypothetical protein
MRIVPASYAFHRTKIEDEKKLENAGRGNVSPPDRDGKYGEWTWNVAAAV